MSNSLQLRQFMYQLRVVASTYQSRKILWLLAVIALGVCVFSWGLRRWPETAKRLAPLARPMYSFDYYNVPPERQSAEDGIQWAHYEAPDWPQVRSLRLQAGTIDAQEIHHALPPELKQSTQLECLLLRQGFGNADMSYLPGEIHYEWRTKARALYGKLLPEDVDFITSDRLSYLGLEQCPSVDGTLSAIAARFPIRTLILDQRSLQGKFQELAQFKQVEFLELRGIPLTSELMATLNKLPRLHTLVLDTYGADSTPVYQPVVNIVPQPLTLADVTPLRTHPTLKWVYVDAELYGLDAITVRQHLAPVRTLPFMESRRWVGQLQTNMVLFGVVFGLVWLQLVAQFFSPASQLLPRFAGPHLLLAGSILFGAMIVGTLQSIGFASQLFLPACTVLLSMPAAVSVLLLLSMRSTRFLPVVLGLIMMSLHWFPMILGLSVELSPGLVRWYLLGNFPVWAMLILLLELVLLGRAARDLCVGFRWATETSITPQFCFQPNLVQAQSQAQYPAWLIRRTSAEVWDWHGHDSRRRVSLWIRSLPLSPATFIFRMWGLMTLALVLFVSAQWWMSANGAREFHVPFWVVLVVPLGASAGMATMMNGAWWQQRSAFLTNETLLPISREDFVNDLFSASLWTGWPALLMVPAIVLLGVMRAQPWFGTVALLVFAIGALALITGGGLLTFALRPGTGSQLLTLLPAMLAMMGMTFALVFLGLSPSSQTPWTSLVLVSVGLLFGLLAVAIGSAAYYRALTREWGA